MVNNPFHKYQNLLKEYIRPNSIPLLWRNWTDIRRSYHNLDHLSRVIKGIENWRYRFSREEFEQLILAAFFHDVIYDPRDTRGNEDKSKKFFRESYIGKNQRFDLVDQAIECTKYRKRPTNFPLRVFWDADNDGFKDSWFDFLKYENGIRSEFSFASDDKYKEGRIKFLESNLGLFGPTGDMNIRKLIKYLEDKYDI